MKWIGNDHRYMKLCFPLRTVIIYIICCYTTQTVLPVEEKDVFNDQIITLVVAAPEDEMLFHGGDLNGHVWKHSAGFEDVHGSFRCGGRNPDQVIFLISVLQISLQWKTISLKRSISAGSLHIRSEENSHF